MGAIAGLGTHPLLVEDPLRRDGHSDTVAESEPITAKDGRQDNPSGVYGVIYTDTVTDNIQTSRYDFLDF